MTTQGTIKDFISGLLLILVINLGIFIFGFGITLPLLSISSTSGIMVWIIAAPFWLIGFSQWLYIIPWARKLWINNERVRLQGIIVGGIITLLLNSTCFGSILMPQAFR